MQFLSVQIHLEAAAHSDRQVDGRQERWNQLITKYFIPDLCLFSMEYTICRTTIGSGSQYCTIELQLGRLLGRLVM